MSRRETNVQEESSLFAEECAPNGAFITLINQSTNKKVEISRWLLVRRVDSGKEHRFTIPDGVRLEMGEELRIYANRNPGAVASTTARQELTNRELTSWGR